MHPGSRVDCSERALLNLLMVKLHQLDADVLVGHNISGFDLDILLHRLQVPTLIATRFEFVNYLSKYVMAVPGTSHRRISEAWLVLLF